MTLFQHFTDSFMSLIVLALVIVSAVNFSQGLIYKTNQNIVASQNVFEGIPKFSLENFKTGFFLNTNFGKIIDPTQFSVSAGVFQIKLSDEGDQQFENIPVRMERCSIDKNSNQHMTTRY